jgi:hypothetical protein
MPPSALLATVVREKTVRKVLALSVAGLAALTMSAGAIARAGYSAYYIDELTVSNSLEAHGVYYGARHVAIDNASCLGLRRYGVHTSAYGLDKFHRFKCDLNGANNHFYTAQISTTTGPKRGYWYWHVLSVKRDF